MNEDTCRHVEYLGHKLSPARSFPLASQRSFFTHQSTAEVELRLDSADSELGFPRVVGGLGEFSCRAMVSTCSPTPERRESLIEDVVQDSHGPGNK